MTVTAYCWRCDRDVEMAEGRSWCEHIIGPRPVRACAGCGYTSCDGCDGTTWALDDDDLLVVRRPKPSSTPQKGQAVEAAASWVDRTGTTRSGTGGDSPEVALAVGEASPATRRTMEGASVQADAGPHSGEPILAEGSTYGDAVTEGATTAPVAAGSGPDDGKTARPSAIQTPAGDHAGQSSGSRPLCANPLSLLGGSQRESLGAPPTRTLSEEGLPVGVGPASLNVPVNPHNGRSLT